MTKRELCFKHCAEDSQFFLHGHLLRQTPFNGPLHVVFQSFNLSLLFIQNISHILIG